MIKKLYNFGKYIPENYFVDNPLRLDKNHSEGKILFMCFDQIQEFFEFKQIEIEDYDKEKNESQYLFLELDSSNSVPFFPIYRIHKAGKRTLQEKLSTAFEKIIKSVQSILEINGLEKVIIQKREIIVNDILSNVNNKETFLLSIKINDSYIGNFNFINKYKNEKIKIRYKDFYTFNNEEIIAKNKYCYLCNNKKENIWGYVSNFNFYAVKTEISVINSGFDFKNTWKNYPVCSECAINLENYKNIITQQLAFRFYGYNYFLIPEIILDKIDNKSINEILLNEKYGLLNFKTLSDTIEIEEDLIYLLKENNNYINFNFFFYKEDKNAFKILHSIDNVFPSRFRKIYEIKENIKEFEIFKNLNGIYKKEEIDSLRFDFRIIQYFYIYKIYKGNVAIYESDFSKHFLSIIESIFIENKIDFNFILSLIINRIRIEFINDLNFNYTCLRALMLIKFLDGLNLWNKIEYIKEKELIMNNEYIDFFEEHCDFFNSNSKKAIFLEGVLCQLLLEIQYRERKATPFRTRLNSLKLDEQIVKRLLPEIINKLEEYESNYYKPMESIISEYLLDSKFNMSNDEISFYFVMGMSLARKFKLKTEEEI